MPLPDFENIDYLKSGSPIQKRGCNVISESKILYHLKLFRPILAGTLPLDLFIAEKSDLDIICESTDLSNVEKILLHHYGRFPAFFIGRKEIKNIPSLVCRFVCQDFDFEIFCQPVPVTQQYAYRHMVVEYKLLEKYGEKFRDAIRILKEQGIKTEPAFAMVLGLKGDPYEALLTLEDEFDKGPPGDRSVIP